ncbi:Gfo/Idh/MocA family protein [Psychrobacillus antarcticus]|uniref:Gfo/Idh/MocA family protein n=1 Tax=Psychrobacillus antarcticus TaxID=2879115 RepID=UPI00387E5CBF
MGEILTMRARFHLTLENWDDDIRLDSNLGGGVLNDIGCYPVNVLNYLIEESPINIQAPRGKSTKEIDTHIAVQLSYPSGILAQFDASFYGPMTQTIDCTNAPTNRDHRTQCSSILIERKRLNAQCYRRTKQICT